MNLTMLGNGNALVTECYNTCFILSSGIGNLLVDTGGGNRILHQLKHAGFALQDIHEIFITHSHIDHILGAIWLIRISAQLMHRNNFDGDINIYSHDAVIPLLEDLVKKFLLPYQAAYVGERIHLITLHDGESRKLIGQDFTFFDIHSERTKQYGFTLDKRLTFCGDEPCKPSCEHYVQDSGWLMHEAFCLSSEAEICKPYEKNHSTVKDACENAARLGAKNLLIYHASDENILTRREDYTREAREFFPGNIFVPYDLEVIDLGEEL